MPHSAKSILDKMEIRTILRTISEQLGTCHYLAGGRATILGGMVIIFFLLSGEGSQFFQAFLEEGHNFLRYFY